jgi:CRP/FNR family transcriptional regulator
MMNIETDVLIAYGASTRKVRKGEFIFKEGGEAHYFFHLLEGQIKMVSLSLDGKELLQGMCREEECFGEPPLFIDKPYPSSAIAMKDSVILRLSKAKLFVLLEDRPKIMLTILSSMAGKLYKKAVTSKILNSSNPEEKILSFLDNYKDQEGLEEVSKIPYTRQQIADSTGLCVETVIRTLIKLCDEHKVEIKKHKVFY